MKKLVPILTLVAGLGMGYIVGNHNTPELNKIKKEFKKELLSEVFLLEGKIYTKEGFEFTPGGGYFYYPRGNAILSKKQKFEISNRIEGKLEPLHDLYDKVKEIIDDKL